MKILLVILVFCATISQGVFAQYVEEDEQVATDNSTADNENSLSNLAFRERLFTGGNVGFNIVRNQLYLDVSPMLGYKITEKLGAGIGVRYTLFKNLATQQSFKNYGGSIFARYKVIPQAFLHAEIEGLKSNYQKDLAVMGFLGAGYATGGSGLNFSILLLYDVLNSPISPYRNAYLLGPLGPPVIVRGGVSIGF